MIQNMMSKITPWKQRNLSYGGKVHILKSLGLSQLLYSIEMMGIDKKKFISQVQKIIWDFMWEENPCMVKPEVCMLPKIKGGLDIPCFDALHKVRRLKMLINVLEHPGPWFTLALRHLQCLDDKCGIPYFALQSDNSEKEVNDTNVSQLYKECILAFRELCQKGKVIYAPNIVIWNYYGAIVRSHLMGCSWNINIGRNVKWWGSKMWFTTPPWMQLSYKAN